MAHLACDYKETMIIKIFDDFVNTKNILMYKGEPYNPPTKKASAVFVALLQESVMMLSVLDIEINLANLKRIKSEIKNGTYLTYNRLLLGLSEKEYNWLAKML